MNLEASIQLLSLLAGGVGSGCHGANCGRPRKAGRHFEKGGPASGREAPPWGFDVNQKPMTQEQHKVQMEDFRKLADALARQPKHSFVTHTVKTPGGITYTTLKPRDKQTPKIHDPRQRKHPLKGKFGKPEKHFGAGEARPGQKLRTWISEARTWYGGKTGVRGATVFIHRYTDQQTNKPKATVVDEHNWIDHANRYSPPFRIEFKNSGTASAYVKRRYGVSIPTREYRG